MQPGVHVVASGSVSALGASSGDARAAYATGRSHVTTRRIGDREYAVGALGARAEAAVALAQSNDGELDRSVQLGLAAARQVVHAAGLAGRASPVGVVVASSRGPTGRVEQRHAEFLERGRVRATTSPTTTAGALSNGIARELAEPGLVEGISSTCTGSLQAVLLGAAWLKAGLGDACLVGGSEAPLTAFTLAQFIALGLIGGGPPLDPPCRPLALERPGRLVLAEGACVLALERLTRPEAERRHALAEITGMAACFERAQSGTGITPTGDALARAMAGALRQHGRGVDAVVVHAPGTRRGDAAELAALERVFGARPPPLCSSKWQMGHALGAAGAFGVDLGLALLGGVRPAAPPYASALRAPEGTVRSVLVNAAGFGGAAASIVLGAVG